MIEVLVMFVCFCLGIGVGLRLPEQRATPRPYNQPETTGSGATAKPPKRTWKHLLAA